MVAIKRTMTADEFANLSTQGRHDLVDGELWSLTPTKIMHGMYGVRLTTALQAHVQSVGSGLVLGNEVGFVLSHDRRTILCPDVAYVQADRLAGQALDEFFHGAPDLAVEVVSDSERPREVAIKVERYLAAGTALVWCVHPDLRQVVVHRDKVPPAILGVAETLNAEPLLPGFRLELRNLFRPPTEPV